MRSAIACGLLLLSGVSAIPLGQDRWAEAEMAIVRLSPEAFPELPVSIAGRLHERGCRIPQPVGVGAPANVIVGEFLASGATGFAVLCSVGGVSSILVFNNRGRRAAEVNPRPDRDYLQDLGPDGIGFSRRLMTAAPHRILRYAEQSGRSAGLPEISHDGVEDAFLGKGSSIHYHARGGWVVLPGAD